MKKRILTFLLLPAVVLTGCSQPEVQNSQVIPDAPSIGEVQESTPEIVQQPTEEPPPQVVYYVTDHGTTATEEVGSFLTELAESGYAVETDTLAALPADVNTVIFNTPAEDITPEELAQLDSYMDEGGHILLLMPADEREIRYKNLERLLEEFCLVMDYDLVQETEAQRTYKGDADYVQLTEIAYADGMNVPEIQVPAFQRNARSFGAVFGDNFGDIWQEAILRSASSAMGIPCGGTEDDPETFEDTELMTMTYSRDESRANAAIVAVGSSDFLLDENYTAESSVRMKELVLASLEWLVIYIG